MSGKLYRLAVWYIGKCNAKWENKNLLRKEVEKLDRLTYKDFGKYMLFYGDDAEWQKFGRYDVLDNAIQKLAKYENEEEKNRYKTIIEFVGLLKADHIGIVTNWDKPYAITFERIDEIAEELIGGKI